MRKWQSSVPVTIQVGSKREKGRNRVNINNQLLAKGVVMDDAPFFILKLFLFLNENLPVTYTFFFSIIRESTTTQAFAVHMTGLRSIDSTTSCKSIISLENFRSVFLSASILTGSEPR